MKINANGIQINYEIEGSGPWVVMSHSLACELHMWDEQAAALRDRYRVLRFDTRGHAAPRRRCPASRGDVGAAPDARDRYRDGRLR